MSSTSTILTTKWIFKIKRCNGVIERFKARLCMRGFQQIEGVDYNEIFAPVIRLTSLIILLSIVAAEDLEMVQIDKKAEKLGVWEDKGDRISVCPQNGIYGSPSF